MRMALFGLASCITLSGATAGNVTISMAGMMAKYFATSLAMLKVVNAASSGRLFADFDDLDQLGLVESRSTMLPKTPPGRLRAGVHVTPHVRLSGAGA